jgi:hypothetical protein
MLNSNGLACLELIRPLKAILIFEQYHCKLTFETTRNQCVLPTLVSYELHYEQLSIHLE